MNELERFKKGIDLVDYAMTHDFIKFDRNQSSKTCVVLRRQADNGKIAVSRSHDGHWVYYDFRCNKGGSILDFLMQQTGFNLGRARQELRKGSPHDFKFFFHTARFSKPVAASGDRRKAAWDYAATHPITKNHEFLEGRGIAFEKNFLARFSGKVRSDCYGNACFPYFDFGGIAGIEKRNSNFKSYTKGGRKGLWRSTLMEGDVRAVICEAPIDALSYARVRVDQSDRTRYFATGGQISRFQWHLIDGLVQKYLSQGIEIVLAFDNDSAGKIYVQQFSSRYSKMEITLDLPPRQGEDWNDVLQRELSKPINTGRNS